MLSTRIETVKLGLKLRRYRSRALDRAVSEIKRTMDAPAITRLWQKMSPIYTQDPTSAAKYAQPDRWLQLNALRAAQLGLHETSGLRALDIGCGPGYFLAVGRALGHECFGVDAPDDCLTAVEREVYSVLIQALHCGQVRSPLLIEPFQPLPFRDRPFDLITAFWICFNRHRQPDEWGLQEWRFFVEDALACLRPGGRLFLDLNDNPERYGDLLYYDSPTRDYFSTVGTVDRSRVTIVRP